ncbi:MAG: hypothetical protein JW990_07405, partial [Thermoleophilia bacterium]|nr:hypothetical protein [Thermoleophilia bacterium]
MSLGLFFRAVRRALAVLVLALLGVALCASPAQAAVKVTWGTLPAGWTVRETPADEYGARYEVYFERRWEIDIDHEYVGMAYLMEDYANYYESLDEFVEARYLVEQSPDDTDGVYWEKTWHIRESGVTDVGGRQAYYLTHSYDGNYADDPVTDAHRGTDYWVDLGDGGGAFIRLEVSGDSWGSPTELSVGEVDALWAEAQSIFQSWQIDWGGETPGAETTGSASTTVTPSTETSGTTTSIGGTMGADESGATPWRAAAGGAAAVAAAVAAILGSAVGTSPNSKTKNDPNQPVGYVLHVSDASLTLVPDRSQPFTVQVYQVMPDGRPEPAAANVAMTAPGSVGVQPASGPSPLSTLVWPTGAIPAGSSLLVQATTVGGSHQTTVTLAGEGEPTLEVAFEPSDKQELVVGGGDHVTLVAVVHMPPQMVADP